MQGKAQVRAVIMFSMGKARQGKVHSLGLAHSNNFGRVGTLGMVSGYLEHGLGMV